MNGMKELINEQMIQNYEQLIYTCIYAYRWDDCMLYFYASTVKLLNINWIAAITIITKYIYSFDSIFRISDKETIFHPILNISMGQKKIIDFRYCVVLHLVIIIVIVIPKSSAKR